MVLDQGQQKLSYSGQRLVWTEESGPSGPACRPVQAARGVACRATAPRLGLALRRGLGVDMDVMRGMEYIEKAALQGLPQAQYFATSEEKPSEETKT